MESREPQPRIFKIFAPVGVITAVAALLLLAAAGTGYRFGLWPFRAGFTLMGVAAWLGLAAAGVSLLGVVMMRNARPRTSLLIALAGVVLGLGVAVVPWQLKQAVAEYPFIHDITTDTAQPPEFVTLLAARADAPNTSEYGGSEVASLQKEAYPDIVPVVLPVSAEDAFRRAANAAYSLGWEVAALIADEGRIEATDTTAWFGFKDDIVVRVQALNGEPKSTRIDVRSVSRVGRSDVGANARRIRAFVAELNK